MRPLTAGGAAVGAVGADPGPAQQADGELPDQVDTDRHGDLVSKYGIDVQDLMSTFGGSSPGL